MTTQAALFYARERRRSLAGVPNLFKTHRIAGVASLPVAVIATGDLFPLAVRQAPVTFQTSFVLAAPTPRSGLIFEFGDASGGVAAWIAADDTVFIRAGGPTVGSDAVIVSTIAPLVAGHRYDLTIGALPGVGLLQFQINDAWLDNRANAAVGNFGAGGVWSSDGGGSFASAANGAVPVDVSETGAPLNFSVVEALSVYTGQLPRHFRPQA